MVSGGRNHGQHLSCPPTLKVTPVESDQVLTDNPRCDSEGSSRGSISQGPLTRFLFYRNRLEFYEVGCHLMEDLAPWE